MMLQQMLLFHLLVHSLLMKQYTVIHLMVYRSHLHNEHAKQHQLS